MAKARGKIRVRQSVRLSNAKNNAGNIGHPPVLNNAAKIRFTVNKRK